MADVFISYARSTAEQAKMVAEALQAAGYDVWRDDALPAHRAYSEVIEEQLRAAKAVVVVWSADAAKSQWVRAEANVAREAGTLVQLTVDGATPPLPFNEIQCAALTGWKGQVDAPGWRKVAASVAELAGAATQQPASAPARAAGPRIPPRLLWGGAAAVLCIAIVAAGLTLLNPFARPQKPQVRIANFDVLSSGLSPTVGSSLREELLAAFRTDDVLPVVEDLHAPSSSDDRPVVLSGSVRDMGGSLRFTMHLVDQRTGADLWTHSIDRPTQSGVDAPRQIAALTSLSIRCALSGLPSYKGRLPNEAISAYFKLCDDEDDSTLSASANDARRLTEAAPNYSASWSALAILDGYIANTADGMRASAQARAEGQAAAKKALGLDPLNSEAYQAQALLLEVSDFAGREVLFQKSLTVRPTDCGCEHERYGAFLERVGRIRDALAQYQRAAETLALGAEEKDAVARAQYMLGQTDDADQTAAAAQALAQDDFPAWVLNVETAAWTHRYDQAITTLKAQQHGFDPADKTALIAGFEALKSADAGKMSAAADALRSLSRDKKTNNKLVVRELSALGRADDALAAAARLITERPDTRGILFEPSFAPSRRLPAFAALVARLGLVDYWRTSGHAPDFCGEADAPALCAAISRRN